MYNYGKISKEISAEEGRKLLIQASPFAESLSTNFLKKAIGVYYIRLDSYYYKVVGSGVKHLCDTLKLFARSADVLSEIHFDDYTALQVEALSVLFHQNKIKKVVTHDASLSALCRHNLTRGIEELDCRLNDNFIHNSFQGVNKNVYSFFILFQE